jgi:predicted RNA binding protein YcfA (HicA-like mRNA interferase family)
MKARDLIRAAKREGWEVSTTDGGHLRLEHPEASGRVITGSTPSDRRALYHARAAMKRVRRPKGEGDK